jgi:hypothetical protein
LNAALPIWHRKHAEIETLLVDASANTLRAGLQALS